MLPYIETAYKVNGLMLANHTSICLLMQKIVESFQTIFKKKKETKARALKKSL